MSQKQTKAQLLAANERLEKEIDAIALKDDVYCKCGKRAVSFDYWGIAYCPNHIQKFFEDHEVLRARQAPELGRLKTILDDVAKYIGLLGYTHNLTAADIKKQIDNIVKTATIDDSID